MNAHRTEANRGVDFEVTLVATRPARRCDVRVSAPRGTPVAAVAASLRRMVGLPADDATAAMHVGAVPVDLAAALEDALRPGSLVSFGTATEPVREPGPEQLASVGQPGPRQLHVVGGPDAGEITTLLPVSTVIGRGAGARLQLADPRVSRRHAVARVTVGAILIEDLGSTNGTTVDGVPVAVSGQALGAGELLRVGDTALARPDRAEPVAAVTPAGDGHLAVTRPPRLHAPAPVHSVVLPTRPTKSPRPRFAVLAVVLPLVLGLVMWRVSGQLYFLLFTLLSPVLAIGTAVSDRTATGRAYRRGQTAYDRARAEADQRLADAVSADARGQRRAAPDLTVLAAVAHGPGSRLWERRGDDDDVLQLRVATADGPAGVKLTTDVGEVLEPPVAPMVPVTVRLPDIGVLGIAGGARQAHGLARALLAQATVLHAPQDLAVVILATADRASVWEWARWLPHTRATLTPAGNCRALFGLGAEQAAARTAELQAWVAASAGAPRSVSSAGERSKVLMIVDGARRLRSSTPGLAALLDDGPAAGVHAICLDDDERMLPQECAVVVSFHDSSSTRVSVCRAGGPGVDDAIADTASLDWAERLARALAPLRVDTSDDGGAAALPGHVRWTEIAALPLHGGDGDVAAVTARWTDAACSTTVALGCGLTGPTTVDLAADGPHILVAGTTGSGKSELLRSMVASLVAGNRPDQLSLLLIDYKGGAAFGPCVALPHTVGVVTDLDAAETERALTSLHAELRRRERLLRAAGVADSDAYRRAVPERDLATLPRLVIIVDEFATLSKELPDFVDGLVGVAQRGRSLGVHLVLATQRPEGVVRADIRANTNLRVCLAVTRAAESLDVLETPAAATIPRGIPGRAFLRAGPDAPTPFQTACVSTGSTRVGGALAPAVIAAPYAELGANPVVAPVAPEFGGDAGRADCDLDRLVRAVAGAAERLGIAAAPAPWLPPLPPMVEVAALPPLDATPSRPGGVPAAPYGLQDLPAQQRRRSLAYDLTTAGHLLVTGTAGSGRTTLLRTLAGSLAAATGPADVHLYAVDAGGGSLAPLAELPHCGAVVSRDEPERLDRLLNVLLAEVHRRQRVLATDGHLDVAEQRAAVAAVADRLPYLLVFAHQWDALLAAYQDLDGGRVIDAVLRLLADGSAVGLRAVVTGDRATLLGRLAAVMSDRLLLQLADPADYGVVGLRPAAVPRRLPRGRGWTLDGLVSTQVAVLGPDPAGAAQCALLRRIAAASRRDCAAIPANRLPRRVDAMPTLVPAAELAQRPPAASNRGTARVALGIGGDELGVIAVDLGDVGHRLLVGGVPGSGRSTALLTIAGALLNDGNGVVLVAPRPSPLRALAGRPGVLGSVEDRADSDQLAGLLRAAPRPLAVIVDDADYLIDAPLAVELDRLVTQDGPQRPVLVAAGATEALATTYRPWVVDARRSRAGLLLGPRSTLDGELVGVRLPRTAVGRLPPGRGILVIQGEVAPVQVALPPECQV